MFGTPFQIFGTVHLITIAVVIIVSIILPKLYKNKLETQKSTMSKIIAGIIFLHVIISPYKDLYLLANPYDWRETIPIHMCDLSEIFLIWFLLGGPRILYLCAFFWGLGGATMAILTPDISHHDLDYIFFMVGHGMIVVGIMYATISLGNRPYAKDILTVSAITLFILLPIVYGINLLLGEPANFWYLIAKPDGASLLDMFPDPPLHLLYTTPIAIAMFYLIYLPYFIKDRINK
ncbi:MAG: TIGR02206 family membrane protein [Gammaproteobacteria bacterium]|nr:TIGR02206 family membrane protein [Gammaproteobacteria bacterium]|tara:strand:- start:1566 stop:2267 length:702 start_codon:yes stop_codon:yes gene_type:complete